MTDLRSTTTTTTTTERGAPRLDELRARLRELDRVVVAFSGGADSAFLAWMAHDTLGADRALAATAVSPSLAPVEHDDCRALAAEWSLRWQPVSSLQR